MNVVDAALRTMLRCALAPALVAGLALPVGAQPSGGPYGPVPQTYAVPAGAAHVSRRAHSRHPPLQSVSASVPFHAKSVHVAA